ncbi:undecaprenyl/decaprenyl-phosphate alpha-N-acetylglucosaminyl 1-phosphate transferase [bacterium]|nr:undecaprenyl/decaprenyl-phosphate alpha-N-acetylglucosaminyl 1-phosphate transferase [bacterium]
MDHPHQRKIHDHAVVTMGGIAILTALVLGVLVGFLMESNLWSNYSHQILGLLIGGILIVIMGILDDLIDLHFSWKIGVQILVAFILVLFGYRIDLLTNPFGNPIQLGIFAVPSTILWLIFMFNIINIIDGLDGLAAGTCVIAALTLAVAGIYKNMDIGPMIFICTAGACAGFLRYNYHPASIFMGNVGAYFVGFIFAAVPLIQSFKGTTAVVLLLPIIALGVPIMETVITIFRRSTRKRQIFKADTGHIHHILKKAGIPENVIVWMFYTFSLILGTMAIGFATGDRKLMLLFAFVILVAFSFLLHLIIRMVSKGKKNNG